MKHNKTFFFISLVLMLTINLNIFAQNKTNNQQESVVEAIEEVEEDEKPQTVRFRFIENPPIYPGCENLKGNEAKKCMSKNVQSFIAKKLNTSIASNMGIAGKIKIMTRFTINKEGQIEDIRVRSKYKAFVDEAKRVIKQLPQMKPGMQRGKPIKVTYTLPIIFQVVD